MKHNISIDARMINYSGIGTYLRNLMPLIVKEKNYRFNILCNINDVIKYDWAKEDNVHLIDLKSSIYSIQEQLEMIYKVKKDTELFWSPHYNIPIFLKRKTVVTVHDVFHLAMPKYVKGISKKVYSKLMFNAIKKKADAIVCVSEFTKNELINLTSIDSEKIRIIHNGVDESWFTMEKKYNPHKKSYILLVGNVKPHKNISSVLDAFNLINEKIEHDIVIVGKKEGFITGDSKITEYAKMFGDRIHFTGYVEENELKQYYLHTDLLIFPSFYEGFGLPPLEAMACGCPVLASDIPAVKEVCGDAIKYFNPFSSEELAERIISVLEDDKRDQLRMRGFSRANMFTWEKVKTDLIKVFKEVIEK